MPLTPTPILPWQKGFSSGEMCLLLFLLRQQNRAEKWAPHFYCPPTPTSRLGKTITRLIRVGSHSLLLSPSEEERALCRGQSLSHERKRGIMLDGSLLFPEGGGELPPYANARNWPLVPLPSLDTEPHNYHLLHARLMSHRALQVENSPTWPISLL